MLSSIVAIRVKWLFRFKLIKTASNLVYVFTNTGHIPHAQQPYVVDWCCLITKWCLFCNSMDMAHQAPLSMGFPKQEYWNELPFPSPEGLPDPQGSNLHLLHGQVDSLLLSHQGSPYVVSSSIIILYIYIYKHFHHCRKFCCIVGKPLRNTNFWLGTNVWRIWRSSEKGEKLRACFKTQQMVTCVKC